MTESTTASQLPHNRRSTGPATWRVFAPLLLLTAVVGFCLISLEARFAGLKVELLRLGETPVSLYKLEGAAAAPPVIVAHGFAGSRQMMDQIAVSLARQGFVVASVDLPGHGRNGNQLSPDITRIEGTTAQLVGVIEDVADALLARADTSEPISFVGHSMATDVVIRAAQNMPDAGGVVAISMYSPAVTESSPQALLVVSGAWEGHLRRAGLETVQQIAPDAQEGTTVSSDDILRRTAVAPFVGHVGVLYSSMTLDEVSTWLRTATEAGGPAALDQTGWVAGVLLVGLVLLVRPVSSFIPSQTVGTVAPVPWRTFLIAILSPFPAVALIAALPVFGIGGNAAFGSLSLLLVIWGGVQIAILRWNGIGFERPDGTGLLVYLAIALVFALALDRYGAAFLPVGDRLIVMLGILVGTVPLMVSDARLVYRASLLRRLLARLALLLALSTAMAFSPTELGLTFTVLPVLILFYLVYGTMARWIAARRGSAAVGIGQAVVLAWAIAASTPLFAVAS